MTRTASRSIVLALVAITVAVSIALTLATRRPAPPTAPDPILPADIARLESAGAVAERLAPGVWTVTLPGSRAQWPASTTAVRSALRALADLADIEPVALDEPPATDAAITLTTTTGAERAVAWSSAVIAGKQTALIDAAAVRAPASLLAPIAAGPASWRDRSIFPGVGPAVTRLLIEQPATDDSPALEIELTRSAGRWLIVSPALARASEDAARNAVARVASATIERFIDEPPALLDTGLDEPVFIITVEQGDSKRRVRFGAAADTAGTRRFATTGEAGVLFVANTELLRDLRLDPAAYTDRRASPVAPADVAAITVATESTSRAQRTLRGWSDAPFDPPALLTLLTTRLDALVSFVEPEGWTTLADVTLENLAADPLDVIAVGRDREGALWARTQLPGGAPVYLSLPPQARQTLGASRE